VRQSQFVCVCVSLRMCVFSVFVCPSQRIQTKREPHGRGKSRQLLFPTHLQAASGFPRVGQLGGKETLAAGKRTNGFWEGEIPALLDCGTCGDVLNPTVKNWVLVKIHIAMPSL